MENKKMTKKEMFAEILKVKGVAENTAMVNFINREIELLTRKGSKSTPSKTQIENEGIKKIIVKVLTGNEPMTISDIQAQNETLSVLSNQKISALLTLLIKENKVIRTEIKKKAYFTVA